MQKLGYMILFSMYATGFYIGKTVVNVENLSSKFQFPSTEEITLVSVSTALVSSIGMESFFDELDKMSKKHI